MASKVQLTVLEGRRDRQARVNAVMLKIVPDTLSPLPVEVRIFEEDTHLVLTVDPVMRYTEEHPVRLMTRVLEAKPNHPGSVVINNGSWYAVVHDLDNDPSCRKEWIEKAYNEVLLLGEIKQIRSMGLPLLGSVHGNFSMRESLNMLVGIVRSTPSQHLKEILLLISERDSDTVWHLLKQLTQRDE